MARHRRGFLKASPLGPDCAKAKVSRDDFFVGVFRQDYVSVKSKSIFHKT